MSSDGKAGPVTYLHRIRLCREDLEQGAPYPVLTYQAVHCNICGLVPVGAVCYVTGEPHS